MYQFNVDFLIPNCSIRSTLPPQELCHRVGRQPVPRSRQFGPPREVGWVNETREECVHCFVLSRKVRTNQKDQPELQLNTWNNKNTSKGKLLDFLNFNPDKIMNCKWKQWGWITLKNGAGFFAKVTRTTASFPAGYWRRSHTEEANNSRGCACHRSSNSFLKVGALKPTNPRCEPPGLLG